MTPTAAPKPRFPAWAGLVAAVALFLALALPRLGTPDWTMPSPVPGRHVRYVWDESVYAFTAHRWISGDPGLWDLDATTLSVRAFDPTDVAPYSNYAMYHPPLAVSVMTLSAKVLGWTPVGVRLPGVFAGAAFVALTWLLARRIRGPGVATAAAALVALDGKLFTMARVAIPDAYHAAAIAAVILAALVAWQDDGRRARLVAVTGALCGVALGLKLSAAPTVALVGALLLVRSWRRDRTRGLRAWAVAFLVVAPVVYLAAWVPWLASGRSWADLVAAHRHFLDFHSSVPATMGATTPWWSWPVETHPIRLFTGTADGALTEIWCRPNPFLWWAGAATLLVAAVRWLRSRDAATGLLVAVYLVTWLAYAFVGRFGFHYYLLPAAPCAAVAVGMFIDDVASDLPARVRWVPWTFLAFAAADFAMAYPRIAAVASRP